MLGKNSDVWGFARSRGTVLYFQDCGKGEVTLQRLFSTFPGGWPGIGLLMLRTAIGATAAVQGALYFRERSDLTVAASSVGVVAITSGALMMVGFLTPLIGSLLAAVTVAISLSWLPAPPLNLFDSVLPTFLAAVVSIAVAFLGPGAMSVDARLFGRRKIIIPQTTRTPR